MNVQLNTATGHLVCIETGEPIENLAITSFEIRPPEIRPPEIREHESFDGLRLQQQGQTPPPTITASIAPPRDEGAVLTPERSIDAMRRAVMRHFPRTRILNDNIARAEVERMLQRLAELIEEGDVQPTNPASIPEVLNREFLQRLDLSVIVTEANVAAGFTRRQMEQLRRFSFLQNAIPSPPITDAPTILSYREAPEPPVPRFPTELGIFSTASSINDEIELDDEPLYRAPSATQENSCAEDRQAL